MENQVSYQDVCDTRKQVWQKHISDWEKSGLSVKAYCEQSHLKMHQFKYWQPRFAPQTCKPKKKTLHSFMPVITTPAKVDEKASCRLYFGKFCYLEIRSLEQMGWLKSLLPLLMEY